MTPPLVSVICLCHNHARFVREAIESVLLQTYPNIQLLVVDDASTDESVTVIQDLIAAYPSITFLSLRKNVGNCKAFNHGLALTTGAFIIDLAADDVLLPERIENGVQSFQEHSPDYGVHFSDAEWIDEAGQHVYNHSEKFPHHTIPQGDVYRHLIERYFICSPSMMFKREVMEYMGGYDETLAYEDFDFWIRSSRKFNYCYTPAILVKKRIVKDSLSERQFKHGSLQQESTYQVCKKIYKLNRTREEKRALQRRVYYEIGVNLRLYNPGLATRLFVLLIRTLI
ncbi:MAG: glycosyltransferase [Cyclobacteriaceae bacterium]|nr:glycosyltransferase [Cyclobacteriaceae bacterium]